MDSFSIFIRDADEKEVADFLSSLATPFTYPSCDREITQWNIPTLDQKDVLYVKIANWHGNAKRFERVFQGVSNVHIDVDVSFRIQRTEDIKWFIRTVLSRFNGCAFDEFWYSDNPLFLADLDDTSKHGFFDREGWVQEWERTDHLNKTNQSADFLDQKKLRSIFPTVDSLTRVLSALVMERECREIEDLRISNASDAKNGYARYISKVEPRENYCGREDSFFFPNYDIKLISHYKQPLYVAVRVRNKIVECGAPATVDFFIVNDEAIEGPHTLHVSLFSPSGEVTFEQDHVVNVSGGDVRGQLLKDGVQLMPDTSEGMWQIQANLKDASGDIKASGHDEIMAVNWRDQKIPAGRGAVYEIGASVLDFLRGQKGLDIQPYQDSSGPLDWIIVARAPGSIIDEISSAYLRTVEDTAGASVKFFEGNNFTKEVSERTMSSLDFQWKEGLPADSALPVDSPFGMRWAGYLIPPVTGEYVFEIKGAETVSLKINGRIVDLKHREPASEPIRTAFNETPVDLFANELTVYEMEVTEIMSGGKFSVSWKIADISPQNPEALIARAQKDGTKIILGDFADQWMPLVSKALGTFSFNPATDVWKFGRSFIRAVYFAIDHPLFKDLPINQAMTWPYNGVLNTGRTYYGLKLSGEELAAGCWNCSPFGYASAVGVLHCGKGQIIFSTLDICPHLNDPEDRYEVARKLLCNFVEFACAVADQKPRQFKRD